MLSRSTPPSSQLPPAGPFPVSGAESGSDTWEAGLGPLVALYRGRPFNRDDFTILLLPGVLAVLAPLAYGWWRGSYAYARYGPVAANHWSRPWYLLSTFALAVFLFLVVNRLRLLRAFVAVHQNGLLFRQGDFGRRQLLWSEIAGVTAEVSEERFFGLPLRITRRAVLYPNLGRPVRINNSLKDMPELLSRIKACLYPHLTGSLRQGFQAGQWLFFGPVAIHRQGLRFNSGASRPVEQTIPWEEVAQVNVQAGRLVVEFNHLPTKRIPISRIRNFELLLQMIQQGAIA